MQAIGWYFVFLLSGMLLGGIAGFITHVVATSTSFGEGFRRGISVGQIVIIPYTIGLGILLVWNRPKNAVNILLVVSGAALSILLGALGGLIPLAVLTSRPSHEAHSKAAAVFE